MTLWFENSNGDEREIAQVNNWPEVWKAIDKFIADCNARKPVGKAPFKSYYSRIWTSPTDGRTTIDVGSHTEFFHTDLPYEGVKDDS